MALIAQPAFLQFHPGSVPRVVYPINRRSRHGEEIEGQGQEGLLMASYWIHAGPTMRTAYYVAEVPGSALNPDKSREISEEEWRAGSEAEHKRRVQTRNNMAWYLDQLGDA